MSGQTYTIQELRSLCGMSDRDIICKIKALGINNCMEYRRIMQRSLKLNNKVLSMDEQMRIVQVTQVVEKYCRPYIFKKHYANVVDKYGNSITPQKAKNMANDLTEKTIRKYSY